MKVPYVNLGEQHRRLETALTEAVREVLRHGQFILGPEVAELERRLASFIGVPYVIGVANGTDALVIALGAHGIGSGDEVITVSHSFVATASAICLVGARPVFVDIDAETMVMDPSKLTAAITEKTKAVMPVHLNGYPCDMDAIREICGEHGLVLIEDCAQAIGARYRGRHVGTFGTGCFSLHPLKILSACGDAGFITTNSDVLAEKLRQWRNLGLRDRDHCVIISGNSRLDTIQAAMLLVKLAHFQDWLETRAAHAAAYRHGLKGLVTLPPSAPHIQEVYSAFVIRHPRRDDLIGHLRAAGIDAKIHYPLAIHQQPAFANFAHPDLPVTERTVDRMISLPVTPEMSEDDRAGVIASIRHAVEVFAHA